MRIAIASDHAAVALKADLVAWLSEAGHAVTDLGPDGIDPVDYPDYGYKLAEEIAAGPAHSEEMMRDLAKALIEIWDRLEMRWAA